MLENGFIIATITRNASNTKKQFKCPVAAVSEDIMPLRAL